MARKWSIYKTINGIRYKIFYSECDYYGGSKILTSRMVKLNESNIKDDKSYYEKDISVIKQSK